MGKQIRAVGVFSGLLMLWSPTENTSLLIERSPGRSAQTFKCGTSIRYQGCPQRSSPRRPEAWPGHCGSCHLHIVGWRKLTQHCKAIILRLKINKLPCYWNAQCRLRSTGQREAGWEWGETELRRNQLGWDLSSTLPDSVMLLTQSCCCCC